MAPRFEYRQAEETRDSFARHGVRHLFIGKAGAILLGYPDTTQDADLFLLDEPFAGLDAPTHGALQRLLEGWRERGRTVLVATHDLESAARDFDLVLCLNKRLIAFGPPQTTFTEEVVSETFAGHILRVGSLLVDTAHHHHGAG